MAFMQENYLLESESALSIYNAVKDLPIIDPHNHADVAEIARNANYENMWQVFAATDHYVWEVMRKRGVEERLITGDASPKEKWMELARVMPEVAGNPVFEWIHLDLRRRFGITDILSSETGEKIWNEGNAKLALPEYTPLELLKKMNVEVEKKLGHMVYVSGVSSETNRLWEGWLPDNQFTILEDITV